MKHLEPTRSDRRIYATNRQLQNKMAASRTRTDKLRIPRGRGV